MIVCRWCAQPCDVVLDLGAQPAADHFPLSTDPVPDPVHPLRMALCRACGLAQLAEDATVPDEPRGVEPQALRDQAADAVTRLVGSGLLVAGQTVCELGSPHGGSWCEPLTRAGLHWVAGTGAAAAGAADAVVDVFGMMHEPDQAAALRWRAELVRPGGVLLVQLHSLATILRQGQWNALRHGHFAYYSAPALLAMAGALGWDAVAVETFPLYGGTQLLALRRGVARCTEAQELVRRELADGVCSPDALGQLQQAASEHMATLRTHLQARVRAGTTVLGYGAASRAVALLAGAGIGRELLPAVVDASPAKQGRCLPGSRIPVVGPEVLRGRSGVEVLLFVPDLLSEVRRAFPVVEAEGGSWVSAEGLAPAPPPAGTALPQA